MHRIVKQKQSPTGVFPALSVYPLPLWNYALSTFKFLCRRTVLILDNFSFFQLYCYFYTYFYFPAFGQAMETGVIPSPARFLPSMYIAQRVEQSHCSSIFHPMLLIHTLALSASQFAHENKPSTNIYGYTLGGARTRETDPYQV